LFHATILVIEVESQGLRSIDQLRQGHRISSYCATFNTISMVILVRIQHLDIVVKRKIREKVLRFLNLIDLDIVVRFLYNVVDALVRLRLDIDVVRF
jgi:hypothetical protein